MKNIFNAKLANMNGRFPLAKGVQWIVHNAKVPMFTGPHKTEVSDIEGALVAGKGMEGGQLYENMYSDRNTRKFHIT